VRRDIWFSHEDSRHQEAAEHAVDRGRSKNRRLVIRKGSPDVMIWLLRSNARGKSHNSPNSGPSRNDGHPSTFEQRVLTPRQKQTLRKDAFSMLEDGQKSVFWL
jgi:hypothetical protein